MTSKSVRPQVLRRTRVSTESSFCAYSHRTCMQSRMDGYEYCSMHILEDKNCPFKQCQYISNKTNKRCSNAAIKLDKREGYCADHARRAAHIRQQVSRKCRPKETPDTLLEELEHYIPRGHPSVQSEGKKSRPSESVASKIIDFGSSSDSDMEPLTVDQVWRGDGDSDAESVDSEQEDPLKHAGVYTAEEVALITRDKLIRLQSLYIDQFKRLQHVMKEKKRTFVHTVRKEREALGSIHSAKDDPEQKDAYDGLVALKRYHKRHGQEALLHRQSKERRIAVSEGPNYRPPTYPKCILNKNGGKCGARTVPLAKYCQEHILHDPHQVLYKPCSYAASCPHPVADLYDQSTCPYHIQLEEIEYRLPSKKDEKDESKDEIDVVGGTDTKHEEPHQSAQLQLHIQKEIKLQERLQIQLKTDERKPIESPSARISATASGGLLQIADTADTTSNESVTSTDKPRTSYAKPSEAAPIQSKQSQSVASTTSPNQPLSQVSPTKLTPTQVPSVVGDLLAEEASQGISPSLRRVTYSKTKSVSEDSGTAKHSSPVPRIPTIVQEEGKKKKLSVAKPEQKNNEGEKKDSKKENENDETPMDTT